MEKLQIPFGVESRIVSKNSSTLRYSYRRPCASENVIATDMNHCCARTAMFLYDHHNTNFWYLLFIFRMTPEEFLRQQWGERTHFNSQKSCWKQWKDYGWIKELGNAIEGQENINSMIHPNSKPLLLLFSCMLQVMLRMFRIKNETLTVLSITVKHHM